VRTLDPRRDERVLAALLTGPLGHLLAGLIEWLALLGAMGRRRFARLIASAREAGRNRR
jgi:hypothetical protein